MEPTKRRLDEAKASARVRRSRPEVWRAGSPESEIKFSLRHLVLAQINGRVGHWTATFLTNVGDPALSSVEVVIDAGSLETGATERDNHTRSAGFLNIASFPEIRFRSRAITTGDERRFAIAGDLTIRDATRPVTVMLERQTDPSGRPRAPRMKFTGSATISRKDFGLRWHQETGTGGLIAGDQVDLEIAMTVHRAKR